MQEKRSALTRGALAREAGVHPETVRYYEGRGLLPRPERGASNYRLYPQEAARRIRFIKRAQELGFTLTEVEELLALRANARSRRASVRELALRKREVIAGKIRDLQRMEEVLAALTERCDGTGAVSNCPIIAALEGDRG